MSPAIFLLLAAVAAQGDTGSFVVHNFRFASGEVLPELRLHYRALGHPLRDAAGRVRNAVLVLHGTGGSGVQFLSPLFAGERFDAGQLLERPSNSCSPPVARPWCSSASRPPETRRMRTSPASSTRASPRPTRTT